MRRRTDARPLFSPVQWPSRAISFFYFATLAGIDPHQQQHKSLNGQLCQLVIKRALTFCLARLSWPAGIQVFFSLMDSIFYGHCPSLTAAAIVIVLSLAEDGSSVECGPNVVVIEAGKDELLAGQCLM